MTTDLGFGKFNLERYVWLISMASQNYRSIRRVLIVSSHPLFGHGLRKLLQVRRASDVHVVGIVSSVVEAMQALEKFDIDLVVVDYDDGAVNRDEFLARFMEGDRKMRVVLLSLKEGGSEAIVYDRRTLAASQIDEWLQENANNYQSDKTKGDISTPSKGNLNWSVNMKHGIGAFLVVVVLTAIGVVVLNTNLLLPQAASSQAVPIDNLFDLQFKIIAFLFALIVGLMIYSLIFFRRKPGDLEDGAYITGNSKLEVFWTAVPLIVVIGLAMIGSNALAQTLRMDPKPLEVRVIGQQWAWRFEYPELNITSTELVLPANKQTVLMLTSIDVIHSFWVPQFRVKQDAVPGIERELRVTPTELGDYSLLCTELCGERHAFMTAPVRVVTSEGFDAWVEENLAAVSDDPVVRGQVWYNQYGCAACHTLDGTPKVGPSFLGLIGKEEIFEDGSTLVADEDYIYESIRQPALKIVQGYPNAMPANIAEDMSDEQIADLIEFIKTLK
jgi:cytochrome c oxidase subunit 2